jgi:hypothetical protein
MNLHFILVAFISFTSSSQATSFYIRPFSEFTESAPNIVRGFIRDQRAENAITSDGGKTIYTFARVEVKEVLKGNIHKPEIQIRKVGGSKDGYTLEIPSSPEFKEGEESVFFLSEEKEDQSFEITGLELGKFGVEEKNGGVFLTGGIFNYSRSLKPSETQDHPGPWSINDLKALIQKQAASIDLHPRSSTTPSQASAIASPIPPSRSADQSAPTVTSALPETNSHPAENSTFLLMILGVLVLFAGVFIYRRSK